MSGYLTYKLWKFGVLVLLALLWGIYCGFTGRSMQPGRRDKSTDEPQD